MEVGDSTQSRDPALFEPQTIFWPAAQWHPDDPKFYAAMDSLRSQHPALQQGQTVWLHNSDEQHVVSYLRRSGSEEFLVVVNLSNTPFRGTIECDSRNWKGIELALATQGQMALPFVALDAFGFRVFQRDAK